MKSKIHKYQKTNKQSVSNNLINYFSHKIFLFAITIISLIACERELSDDATLSSNNKNPEVFIDTFSAGLGYGAFGGSKYTAFVVDTEVKYEGTASMRFDVPSVGDIAGEYAGGVFIDGSGRNLTSYDALTFWVKGSKAANLNEIGIGTDFGLNKYKVTMSNVSIGTNWQKVTIPLPDASTLTQEKGLFWYSEAPENNLGYSFWIDNLKYEKLGTISKGRPAILNGIDDVQQTFTGAKIIINGLISTFNMANGSNQKVSVTPHYFKFVSSDTLVAKVNKLGLVDVKAGGTCTIKATFAGVEAQGSLTINSLGDFTPAPTPTRDPSNVISLFSDAYTNVAVDYYNGFFNGDGQTTQGGVGPGGADISINGNGIINYTNLNFVAIGTFLNVPTINASAMTHLHVDINIQEALQTSDSLILKLINNVGGAEIVGIKIFNSNALISNSWLSLDIPLSSFTGLSNRSNLGLLFFDSAGSISNIYIDNIYFYNIPTAPIVAAPTPTVAAANVISVFSDTFTNIAANLNPNWNQATVVSQTPIAGNNTLKYTGLNYQGIEFGTNQNLSTMTHLHIDYYSANSNSLKTYLISPGPVEKSKTLSVPTNTGWKSIEIPLTDFLPVNLTNVFQMKFDGNGTIYLDNIYFHN